MATIGILHPGAMGASLGAAATSNGHTALWVAQGRSDVTRRRAEADGLSDVRALDAVATRADIIISVCPPAAATDVAAAVAATGFTGIYLDANAVAPATARGVAATVRRGGAAAVDGGIIGPPARAPGLTVLYLSGESAAVELIEAVFDGSVLATHRVEGPVGAASATKMAFAAWTKGTSALLLAIRALAEREGVADALEHAWSVLTPDLPERLGAAARASAPKAWRFEAEMHEIADTFSAAGLPAGFHRSAAEVFGRLTELRDRPDVTVDDVLDRL